MSDHSEWVTATFTKARQLGVIIPDPVWDQLDALIRGKLSARPIPPIELAKVATQLMEAMVPEPPETKEPR
jgi:hypothetical protein